MHVVLGLRIANFALILSVLALLLMGTAVGDGLMKWESLPLSAESPFKWPPIPTRSLVYPAPERTSNADFFRQFNITDTSPAGGEEVPWSPADPGTIELPDGMPVLGNPSGLAMLEQAVGKGIIVGEVSDATTLDPISGALVDIIGTGRTAETDAQGRFQFQDLPPGVFDVEATQLGYFSDKTVITVIEGSPSEVRFGLRVKPTDESVNEYTLEEVSVVGEYNGDSAGDLFLDLNIENTVSAGLSSEDFTKNAVSDAGDAVEKISGANIVDGKFAVVRGLADRYITTTLNGGSISSAVPSRKAVRLDLFPTSALSGINVEKLYSPNLSGDFGGAAIDIRTKVFPTEPVAEFKLKQEYNPELPDKMMLSADRDLEYFGGLGENLNQSEIIGSDLKLITTPAADAAAAWKLLHGNRTLRPIEKDTEQKQSFSATIGDSFEVSDGVKVGFLVAGGAGGEDSFNETKILRQTGSFWNQEEYQRQREWNLYAAAGIQLGEFHEVSALYFRKNITQQNVNIGTGIDDGGNNGVYGNQDAFEGVVARYGAAADVLGNFYEIDPVEQDLEILQLSGRHQLGERGLKLSWSMTDSDALEDRPNYSIFRTTTLDFTATEEFAEFNDAQDENFYVTVETFTPGTAPDFNSVQEASDYFLANGIFGAANPTILASLISQLNASKLPVDETLGEVETVALNQFFANPLNGTGPFTQRTKQSTVETGQDRSINLEMPFYLDDDSEDRGFSLGLGISNSKKIRKSRVSIYDLVVERNNAAGDFTGGLPTDQLYAIGGLGELIAADPSLLDALFTGDPATGPFYLDDSLGTLTTPGGRALINNVDATHSIQSHYFSANFFAHDTFFQGGVRFESENRRARLIDPKPPLTDLSNRFNTADGNPAPINEDAILPAFSAGTSFMDGKLSVLGSWSRTTTRPTFYEWVPNETIDLSTGLIRYGNENIKNAQVENIDFSADLEINDSANFRVSYFDKTIKDPIVELFFDSNNIFFDNGDEGKLRGVELELELKEIGPFNLVSNLTYIDAELNYTVSNGGTLQETSSSFPYQPEWIFNANLGYENEEHDFGINLIYNFVGENTTIIRRRQQDPSLVLGAVHSLDLVMRKGFGDEEYGPQWQLVFGVKNLYATDKEFRWDGGQAAIDGMVRNTSSSDRTYFVEAKCSF